MLNRMKQDGQAKMQQVFNGIMQKSIQKSGAQVDPKNIPASLGLILANAMLATLEEAKANKKQVPAQVVLQSAVDIAKEALSQFSLKPQELEAIMAQVFSVAMESFLAMAQEAISPEERAKYEQFMQMVNQGMQQEAPQPSQGDM
ncbi:hypothetical protein [Vibrio sp. TBV020]|uniref:hypothetical protein n=1 Tax=Vibrio sp. TBV020 TaxID=3137398 RepID=UPI0038CDBA01